MLFAALLPGELLGWHHILSSLLGLAGCAILVTDGGRIGFDLRHLAGYLAAAACALTWSGYSVLSRRFRAVHTDTVGWFCGAAVIGGLVCNGFFEEPFVSNSLGEGLAITALGLGPAGAAFFAWDISVKRCNIRLRGVISYFAPLISALLLVAFGKAAATLALMLAYLLNTAGALLAAREMLAGRRT